MYPKAVKSSQADLIEKCKKVHETDLGPDSWNGTSYSADLCRYSCVLLGKNVSQHMANENAVCNQNPFSVSLFYDIT